MIYVSLVFIVLIALIFLGIPVFLATLITSIIFMLFLDIPFSVAIIKIFGGIDSFSLMAIPFFILAGNIMTESKITERILDFANALVRQLKGGLGHVNIIASMLFAGIQGSGAADASAIGSVLIPAMVKQGYDKDYAVAVTASSSIIGPIIPPSIAMILYAYYTELSVGRLFLGAFFPGVLIGIGLMIVHSIYYRVRKYNMPTEKFSFSKLIKTGIKTFPALIMAFIILFGILFGIFSPTEAGIVASVYGLFYGFVISKSLNAKKLCKIFINSAETTAVVMISIAMAGILSNVLVRLNFQNSLIQFALERTSNPYSASLLIILFLLILGCFMDPPVIIAMFSYALLQTGVALGFDPIHYGVLMTIVMQIGAITPPVGSFLFISCSIAKIPLESSVKVLIPFFLVILCVTILILFVPDMVLFLNNIFFP